MSMKTLTLRHCLLPLCVSAAFLLSACSSSPAPQEGHEAPSSAELSGAIVDQRWDLLLIGTDEKLAFNETPFFEISRDGTIAGYDGCNRFTGQISLGEGHRFDVKELASTRMACPDMENAAQVTNMLEGAYRYLIDHDRLVLFGPDSRVLGGWREGK